MTTKTKQSKATAPAVKAPAKATKQAEPKVKAPVKAEPKVKAPVKAEPKVKAHVKAAEFEPYVARGTASRTGIVFERHGDHGKAVVMGHPVTVIKLDAAGLEEWKQLYLPDNTPYPVQRAAEAYATSVNGVDSEAAAVLSKLLGREVKAQHSDEKPTATKPAKERKERKAPPAREPEFNKVTLLPEAKDAAFQAGSMREQIRDWLLKRKGHSATVAEVDAHFNVPSRPYLKKMLERQLVKLS